MQGRNNILIILWRGPSAKCRNRWRTQRTQHLTRPKTVIPYQATCIVPTLKVELGSTLIQNPSPHERTVLCLKIGCARNWEQKAVVCPWESLLAAVATDLL